MADWREVFRTHTASEQLFSHLKDIGTTEGMYRVHFDEVTQDLVDAGIVKKPALEDISEESDRWREVAKAILNIDNKQNVILPHWAYPESDFFSRKQDVLLPVRYHPEDPIDVAKNLEQAIKTVNLSDTFVGYDIQGVFHTDRYYRATTLVDCTRGHLMHNARVVTDKDVVFLSYKSPEVQTEGANASVRNVPSIDSDKTHEVSLERIAIYDRKWGSSKEVLDQLIKSSYNLESHHACRRVTRKSGFARRTRTGLRYGSEVDFDYHTVAAFRLIKRELESKGFRVADPFFIPDLDFLRIFRKLHRNVLIEYDINGHVKRNPMRLNEMEITSWKIIGYLNSRTM